MNVLSSTCTKPTLATWSRTARPVVIGMHADRRPSTTRREAGVPALRDTDRIDDLMFAGATALMAMPWLLVAAALIG